MSNEKALKDIRVLDLANPSGLYCTKLLADLGADVIRIEPPGGDLVRRIGPFYKDDPDLEKSLFHFHFNTNKKSVTLNLETEKGKDLFKELVKTADIMVETYPPGYLDSMGLGYPYLKEINSDLILVSITGFGQQGPYRDFKSSDLVAMAVSGVLYMMGFPEDPPTTVGANQAFHMAGANGAIGALMALTNRDNGGDGQWIDISTQVTALRLSEMVPFTYWIKGKKRQRTGLEYYRALKTHFPCKDGIVICSALGGRAADEILKWMDSKGMAGDLLDEKYAEVISVMKKATAGDKATRRLKEEFLEMMARIESVWEAFLKNHTKEELFVGAQKRGVALAPVNNIKDVVEDIGLNARNYFVDVVHPELNDTLKYPGAPYQFTKTPWEISRRAPLLGEHNSEIYEKELKISKEELISLEAKGVV